MSKAAGKKKLRKGCVREGAGLKTCNVCRIPKPYNRDFFALRSDGRGIGTCRVCERVKDRERDRSAHRRAWVKRYATTPEYRAKSRAYDATRVEEQRLYRKGRYSTPRVKLLCAINDTKQRARRLSAKGPPDPRRLAARLSRLADLRAELNRIERRRADADRRAEQEVQARAMLENRISQTKGILKDATCPGRRARLLANIAEFERRIAEGSCDLSRVNAAQ